MEVLEYANSGASVVLVQPVGEHEMSGMDEKLISYVIIQI